MSEFLKCDADGCSHVENVDAITADMIGRPCPVCGASLLTAEDFAFYDAHVRPAMDLAHKLGLSEPAQPGEPGAVAVNFHDGELRIRAAKP